MKIGFINRINDRSESALCKGLHDSEHEVIYIGEPEDPDIQNFPQVGIPVHALKVKNRFDFKAIKSLKALLKEYNFDVIYCPAARPLSALLLASIGQKLKLVSYRGSLTQLSKFSPVDRLAHLSSKVDKIVCNSRAVSKTMRSFGVAEDKLEVVYKGHDLAWYDLKPSEEFVHLNISKNKFILACIANLRPGKGGRLLLQAMHKLKKDGILLHLLQIGSIADSNFTKDIKSFGLSDDVSCLGFKKDAIAWIPHCNLSVMPSLKKESFSRAIVESMAQNVPVLASNVGGMSELIDDNANGMLFEPRNLNDLVEKIKFAYNSKDKIQEMASNAYKDIQKKYTIEKYVKNYEEVFQSLV